MVTSLLCPTFFGQLANTTIHFLVKKPSLIQSPRYYGLFFWPIGDRINEVLLELTLIGQFCLQSDHCHFQINEALPPNHARGIRLLVWAFQINDGLSSSFRSCKSIPSKRNSLLLNSYNLSSPSLDPSKIDFTT